MSRIKSTSLTTAAEFHAAVNQAADAESMIAFIAARRDRAIQRIQERFGKMTAPLVQERDAQAALAEKYAGEHRAELLPDEKKAGGKKSAETALAIFGWRTGNRMVRLTSKKVTEAFVIAALKALGLGAYVRTTDEIAKDKILADATTVKIEGADVTGLTKQMEIAGRSVEALVALSDVGLKIAQTEAFFIEPKVESAEKIKAPEAMV